MDQTTPIHANGTFSAGGTTSSAGQTGTSLAVNAITGTLNVGDIITIDGVNAVNRVTKQTTGALRQFVVTANVLTGATTIPIYPAIVPASSGNAVQYQTVDVSPGNSAQVRLVIPASTSYRYNFAYAKQAVTMVTADLEMPPNVKGAREQMDGVSMRAVTQYVIGTDQTADRLDVLFGWLFVRPEWACIVADKV